MKPVTAEAMQWRAFGSMLLVRKPAFISLTAAYPSNTVHWPEPNMPIAVGPFALSTRLNCASIRSKACFHETGVNSPSLSYLPSFMRMSGVVRRSAPYRIFERK